MAVDAGGQVGHQHVDDQEACSGLHHQLVQLVHVGQRRRTEVPLAGLLIDDGDALDGVHPGAVGAGRVQAGPDGVSQPVLGGEQDHVTGVVARRAVGPGAAGGHDSHGVRGHGGLAQAGVTVEGDHLADGQTALPQPSHPLGHYLGQQLHRQSRDQRHRRVVVLGRRHATSPRRRCSS